ncbi:MAG: type III pantothenate kinase [Candidatus Hatepunaea meridiana]|nr:type III pantothenate kinase [Candidatus Hatepunaea meridiana]
MKRFLLAVDIGNTTLECGLYDGEKLTTNWRLSSTVDRTPDECWQSTVFFCKEANIDPGQLNAIAIASVVPGQTRSFVKMTETRFDNDPLVISIDTCSFLNVRYSDPRQVGADRLCNAYAGYHHYGGPLIIVDFGTAVTLDVVAEDSGYLGGIILPGPRTAARVLHSRTAQLPQVSLRFPDKLIGVSTDHSIQAGLTWGMVDMIDGLIERISIELGKEPYVVSTGGLAEPFASRSRNFRKLHPDLVLEGIRLIYSKTRG